MWHACPGSEINQEKVVWWQFQCLWVIWSPARLNPSNLGQRSQIVPCLWRSKPLILMGHAFVVKRRSWFKRNGQNPNESLLGDHSLFMKRSLRNHVVTFLQFWMSLSPIDWFSKLQKHRRDSCPWILLLCCQASHHWQDIVADWHNLCALSVPLDWPAFMFRDHNKHFVQQFQHHDWTRDTFFLPANMLESALPIHNLKCWNCCLHVKHKAANKELAQQQQTIICFASNDPSMWNLCITSVLCVFLSTIMSMFCIIWLPVHGFIHSWMWLVMIPSAGCGKRWVIAVEQSKGQPRRCGVLT